MSVCKASARRPYFEVLLRWGELDWLEDMRSDGPLDYYRCLLAGLVVEQGRAATFYKAKLQDVLPALEDGGVEGGVRRCDVVEEEESDLGEEVVDVAIEDAERVEETGDHVKRPRKGKHKLGSRRSSSSSSSSSSSISSSSDKSHKMASADENDDVVVEEDEAIEEDAPWPHTIDGQATRFENRMDKMGQSYKRLIIRCKWHAGCGRKRNTGMRQRSHLVLQELIAFFSLAGTQQANTSLPREHTSELYHKWRRCARG